MDSYRKRLDKAFGKGGIHCYCCRPGKRKDRVCIARNIKRTIRQQVRKELAREYGYNA